MILKVKRGLWFVNLNEILLLFKAQHKILCSNNLAIYQAKLLGTISNATNILGTKIINATAIGNRFNQHNSIKASYLILGNVALNQTKIKQKIQVFKPKIIACKFKNDSLINIKGKL